MKKTLFRTKIEGKFQVNGSPTMIEAGGHDEHPIGFEIETNEINWERVYMFFLRIVSILWLLKSISYWGMIVGLGDTPFIENNPLQQTLIVAFSILDCAAGVGLWLLSPWGKSLWLLTTITEVFLGISNIGEFIRPTAMGGVVLCLFIFILLYVNVKNKRL